MKSNISLFICLHCVLWTYKSEACCYGTTDSASSFTARMQVRKQPLLRKRAMEIVTRKQMLKVLGLEDLPKPNHKVIPHFFMLELYNSLSKGRHIHSDVVSTVRGLVDQECTDNSTTHKFRKRFVFNVSAIPTSDKIVSAELRILRLPLAEKEKAYVNQHGVTYKARLYRPHADTQVNYPSTLNQLDEFTFNITDLQPRWNVFNVKKIVEMWQSLQTKHVPSVLQFQIESLLSKKLIPPEDLGFKKEGRRSNQQALLVVFSKEGKTKSTDVPQVDNTAKSNAIPADYSDKHQSRTNEQTGVQSQYRVKRAIPAKKKNSGKKDGRKKSRRGVKGKRKRRKERTRFCRRHPLYVDFKQLGWANWVIAPRGYNAYYCDGPCVYPIGHYLRPTNHAVVQTLWHAVKPQEAPPACCVPNKLKGISMLYIDSNSNMVYKKYEDMIVERCGCK